jgi:uncharacterized membrane protein YhaH (DUF805 family)
MSQPATYADSPRVVSPVDRVLTVLLMVGLAVLVPIAGFMGLMTSMASDGCGGQTCDATLLGVGVFTSALSPAAVFVAALVWVVLRWRRGRSTWWVPLAAVVAGVVCWFAGALITFSAVG